VSACPRCSASFRGGHQVYSVEGELGKYVFDVELARRIVKSELHTMAEIPPVMLVKMLEVNEEHCPEHIDHVNPRAPGIVGQRLGGMALIDGNHRARRCLRDGLPFRAYLLDLVESAQCMIHQEPVNFTPEMMAREIRGMLRNNPQVEMLTTEMYLDAGEDVEATESALRVHLTAEENARWTVRFTQEASAPNVAAEAAHG
jgi:hypothetical protein